MRSTKIPLSLTNYQLFKFFPHSHIAALFMVVRVTITSRPRIPASTDRVTLTLPASSRMEKVAWFNPIVTAETEKATISIAYLTTRDK